MSFLITSSARASGVSPAPFPSGAPAPRTTTASAGETGDGPDARWIGAPETEAIGARTAPRLRKRFRLDEPCVAATAWVASIGYHELHVNGSKVGEAVLMPSVSDLSRRARSETYDLTGRLHRGENVVGLWLGSGWSAFERFGRHGRPLVRASLQITLASGRTVQIVTDPTWKVGSSPLSRLGDWAFGHYGGERHEVALEQPDWCDPEFDDSSWPVAVAVDPQISVSPDTAPPNRRVHTLRPAAITAPGPGQARIDMGRQFTGMLELDLEGAPGSTISIDVSERADLPVSYRQHHELVVGDSGTGHFENRFNYTSGRWINLSGVSSTPTKDQVRAYLVRSAYRPITTFSCSDDLLQRIHDTAIWTFECLSLGGYVVDCPHRERWGYGGDAHATMWTALTHFDMRSFYAKWLEDWRDVQGADGNVAYTAPTYEGGGGPAWSGIVIALPWACYLDTGEREFLEAMYPTMRRWIAFLETRIEDGLVRPYGHPNWGFLGDWVAPGKGQSPGQRASARSTLFFNNAYVAGSLGKLERIATILGQDEDARRWHRLGDALRRAIAAEFYVAGEPTAACTEQPYLAEALLFGLPDPTRGPALLERLEREILVTKNGHLDTGIHGTAFLIEALGRADRDDLVATVARQPDEPGWGWMLASGATTFWEQWDGVNSRCHSSFLSIGAWFVDGLAGIRVDPEAPGWKHFFVRPAVVGDLTWVRCTMETVRGPITSNWRIEAGELFVEIHVPRSSSASVLLPVTGAEGVREGGRRLGERAGLRLVGREGRRLRCDVREGDYRFTMPWP